jgi:hypothetical protein
LTFILRHAPNGLGVQRAGVSQLVHPLRALPLQLYQFLISQPGLSAAACWELRVQRSVSRAAGFTARWLGRLHASPRSRGICLACRSSHADDSTRCAGDPARFGERMNESQSRESPWSQLRRDNANQLHSLVAPVGKPPSETSVFVNGLGTHGADRPAG